ncbi:hypothetical protein REPUB_Repub06bG0099600 [Reevesia pubescens]
MDDTFLGNFGPAGIGGILRDESGSVKLMFSKSVGNVNSVIVELVAIKKLLLFLELLANFSVTV